jgi:UDP-N-acetyl-alpha-D-muramoyl-L-alanyl-L-glutamate epimerase
LAPVYRSRHQVSLVYGIDALRFETAYWYEDVDLCALEASWGAAVMDRLCFHMLMLEASKLISLAPQELDLGRHGPWYTPAFERMWRRVLHKVWGQWRYRHDQPDYRGPRVLADPVDRDPQPIAVSVGEVATLVFCGGGKDSLVCAKLLERSLEPFATFGYSSSSYGQEAPQHALIDRLVQRCAGSGHHRLRIFDNCVVAPVAQAYSDIAEMLAAETPCSLFAALPVLLQHGYDTMVLAHERSANTGNLIWERTGEDINHQWGKSYEAERLLNDYIRAELIANVSYYSVLQPVYDTTIFNLLRLDQALIAATHSCNVAKPWCGRCPKCAYVWLNYMAYLDPARVRQVIPGNLFEVEENQRWYFQMLGLGEHTPFECIGQIEEVRLAFELCRRKGLTGRAMSLYSRHFPELDTGPILVRFLSVDLAQSGIPAALAQRLGPLLEEGARQGWRYVEEILKCHYARPNASA